jgi:hypothetical protein
MTILPEAPWEELPREVADLLRPELPALADEIVAALVSTVPAYTRPLQGGFGRGVRTGVEQALTRFLALVEGAPAGADEPGREVYRALGRGEFRVGRSLDALQSAYRIGARVAWRRLADAGARAGLDAATLHLLAEAIFAYIDELSSESVEGYAQAQAQRAGERERRHRRLFAALTAAPVDEDAVASAAAEATWPLPRAVAGLALRGVSAGRLVARLGDDALAVQDGELVLAVWPDPDGPGRSALAVRAVRGRGAIGWTAPVLLAGGSLDAARATLALADEGALGDGPWRADDHLAALALRDLGEPAERLAARRLAPFDGLTPRARERLQATLFAWLRADGHRPTVARALGVHPQTVRYRMGQLGELLGAQLADPEARFELELVLRREALALAALPAALSSSQDRPPPRGRAPA